MSFPYNGIDAVAIGTLAGQLTQSQGAVAIGNNAGNTSQSNVAVAIGYQAGKNTQSSGAVAIGNNSGFTTQGFGAVAVGNNAGLTNQGANAVAIGNGAGQTNLAANCIVLNASGIATNTTTASSCLIRPMRGLVASTLVYYNTSTFELSYLASSASTKNTIKELKMDTSAVYRLSPKTYLYNSDPNAGSQIGYIAEEVAELHKKFATYNEPDGKPVAIDYNTIVVFLVEEMKKLRERIRILEGC